MIKREKLFLVASNVDDSIKSQTSVYEITLFKSFVEFEQYIDKVYTVIDTLIITTNELQFTNTNMERLLKVVKSPFLTIKGSVVYLIDKSYNLKVVNGFLTERGIVDWAVYQGNLTNQFIHEIISGEARDNSEGQVDLVTYRIRRSEYVKAKQQEKFQNNENDYVTDEEMLSEVPTEPFPEEIKPVADKSTEIMYLVGDDTWERTTLAFLLAQYRVLKSRTLMVERDYKYHRLTEIATKSGLKYEYVDINEIYEDSIHALEKIRDSQERLVIVGSKDRRTYDYNFIFDIIENNLEGYIDYFIRECDFTETPYGRKCLVVTRNTIPDVLECCNKLRADTDLDSLTFIGVQMGSLGPVDLSSNEMKDIISAILGKQDVQVESMKIDGLLLCREEGIYDLFGILNGTNRR